MRVFETKKGGFMQVNKHQSFGAIWVPLKYDSKKNYEKTCNAANDVFYKYDATGLIGTNCYAMFFRNKRLEDMAENALRSQNIEYIRSSAPEQVSLEERNFWAKYGRLPSAEELDKQ